MRKKRDINIILQTSRDEFRANTLFEHNERKARVIHRGRKT